MIRIFGHFLPRSLLYLGLGEALIFILSIYLSVIVRFSDVKHGLNELSPEKIVVFAVVMLAAMMAMGLYQRDMRGGVRAMALRLSISFIVGFSIMALLFYITPSLFLGRGVMFLAAVSAFGGVLLSRIIFLKWRWADHEFLTNRIMVVGTRQRATRVEQGNKNTRFRGMEIVGYLPIDQDENEISQVNGNILPRNRSIPDLVKQYNISEIVVAVDDRRKTFPAEELLKCKMKGINITDDIAFLEKQTGKMDVSTLHPSSLIFADGYVHGLVKTMSKRLLDILISSLIMVAALPVMLLTALAIWIESGFRGSIFYCQTRVGANDELFKMMKFRSMIENAETNGAQWAEEDDPRITRVGHFIRKTRIDELPQLFNVLKGQMSMVGPRPERPEFVDQLSENIRYYSLRHSITPGITGWAQICFPYGASEEDALQKLQYDMYYIKNYSVFLDLTILFQTAQVVLWHKGSR